jgi:hypothetical protein
VPVPVSLVPVLLSPVPLVVLLSPVLVPAFVPVFVPVSPVRVPVFVSLVPVSLAPVPLVVPVAVLLDVVVASVIALGDELVIGLRRRRDRPDDAESERGEKQRDSHHTEPVPKRYPFRFHASPPGDPIPALSTGLFSRLSHEPRVGRKITARAAARAG